LIINRKEGFGDWLGSDEEGIDISIATADEVE
jgi:hypothetical protein